MLPGRDEFASRLRGFGPVGLLAILVIIAADLLAKPVSALMVLAWAWRSRTPWRDLGFVRPRSWPAAIVIGVAIGVALKLVMKAVVMPLLGAPSINQAYHFLVGNRAALPAMLYAIVAGAAFGEETLFRGFAFERLHKLFGSSTGATIAIVVLTSLLFGIAHYHDQGLPGVQQAVIVGLVFGSIFARTGSLVIPMVAHAAFDLTALWIIYWDLEEEVGRAIFR
jgi:membrane protease YdiL (CAAX protease family)